MTSQTAAQGHDKIPPVLLRMMAGLALSALAIVTFAVATGREPEGRPQPAATLAERQFVIHGGVGNAVTITEPSGAQIVALEHSGFISVVLNGLKRERMQHGVAQDLPVTLTAYANGRLSLSDPATGWAAELNGFGADNKAAFARLLDQ